MIEALWYGAVAALSFIGFVALIYYIVLSVYKTKKHGEYILTIPSDCTRNELRNLIYGAHIRNMIYTDSAAQKIVVLDTGISDELFKEIALCENDCGKVLILDEKELIKYLRKKADDGGKSYRTDGQCRGHNLS